MNLGMVGLGRMGGNMVERLRERGHTVETYARTSPERTADSLVELASKLAPAARPLADDPGGRPDRDGVPDATRPAGGRRRVVDGGNSNFRDSQRRAQEAAKKKVAFLDAGVSGGIWGLENGYC